VAALRALADPTRLEIYRMIATRREPVCVCEITDRFDVKQPTVSYHLRILRRARLVDATRRGVWAYYAARPEGPAALRSFLDSLRGEEAECDA
jgi:ArsR family transcriptional regulator